MQHVYKNIEEYNPGKKRKVLIVIDEVITNMISNKKLNSLTTKIFSRDRKLNILLVVITQSYLKVPKM